MRLDEIGYIISQYTNVLDQPEEFNTRMNWGQNQLFYECIKNKDFSPLEPFKYVRGENGTPPLTFVNGICLLPTDYVFERGMYYLLDGEPIRVNVLNVKDYENFMVSPLEYPTKKYPIANIISDHIRLLPKDIRFVVFTYIKKPTDIFYAIDTSLGYAQYDSVNSVEFEWDENNQVTIIMLVLESLGIIATREEINAKKK
jgi:hypothetical protein